MRSVSPSSSTTIAVSPMMRLTPSVTPVAMFERTLGSSTRRIVAMRVLPSAKAASRMCAGTACRPSRVAVNIGGSAISDIIAPAAMNERPNTPPPAAVNENGANRPSWKIARPNSAITMSGVPATISMLDSTTRASHVGRPYSAIHSALPTASGDGEHDADHGQQRRAEQRVEEAARAGSATCSIAGR